jgi:membrane protein
MPISSPAVATPGHTVLRPFRDAARQGHPVISKFLQDRGPHLAAMVAYYALLSLVPFIFLAVSLLGFVGQISASSYLIRELGHILPGQSTNDLLEPVHSVQRNAGAFGVIGLFGILWASLGFYSALESALNIVFRVQNRAFLHQKWVTFVLVMVSVVVLFASLLTTIAATGWVDRHAPDLIQLNVAAYLATMVFSSIGSFLFLIAVYRYLTNVELRRGDVWPGAVVGAVLFQMSFQALPLYLRFSDQLRALRAFGGLVILLVWLYLMANIIVLGAEINWFYWSRRQPSDEELSGLA